MNIEQVTESFNNTCRFGLNELRNVQNRTDIGDVRKLEYQRSALRRVIEQLEHLDRDALELVEELLEQARAS
jgi:hypothetical protein